MSTPATHWIVDPEEAGERLDAYAAKRFDRTRSQIQKWIRAGNLQIAGRKTKPSTVVEAGMEIRCQPPPIEADPDLVPEPGELALLFADEHVAVIDKPAGLAVHPGAGRSSGTLVHRLIHHFPEIADIGVRGRPGIVHRLDLDTTGVLIVAKTEKAQRRLQEIFAERQVEKTYLALAHGVPDPGDGSIDQPIGRHPQDRKRMTIRPNGRPARTGYRTLARLTARAKVASALEIDLYTGRTHQIRVHLKAIGHPLIGDPVYGEARWRAAPKELRTSLAAFARPALHAWKLALPHPISGAGLAFEAPVPADLTELWSQLGGSPEVFAA